MAYLEHFSDEERLLIVSIPYRAGLWISQSDTTGNPGAAFDERKALENAIAKVASGMFRSAFTHEVMSELWAQKADWQTWEGKQNIVLQDTALASRVVDSKLNRRDLDAYRATIMHIAMEVAKAFRETPGKPSFIMDRMILAKSWLRDVLRGDRYDPVAIMNISKMEDKALEQLAQALSEGPEVAAI
jgi:hypothetical protein